jgi:hypothetical protein
LLSILILFGLWRRLPRSVSLVLLAGCGALVGAGALLVQDRASGAEWAFTLLALAALTPLHASLVFGRRERTP